MRFLTILLLLVVFFFGGMSYGSFERDRQTTLSEDVIVEEHELVQDENMETFTIESEPLPMDDPDYTVHRTASFFEKIVTKLYELIIKVLYTIANLFFE